MSAATFGSDTDRVLDLLEQAWLSSLHVPGGLPENLAHTIWTIGEAIKRTRGPDRIDELIADITRDPNQGALFDGPAS